MREERREGQKGEGKDTCVPQGARHTVVIESAVQQGHLAMGGKREEGVGRRPQGRGGSKIRTSGKNKEGGGAYVCVLHIDCAPPGGGLRGREGGQGLCAGEQPCNIALHKQRQRAAGSTGCRTRRGGEGERIATVKQLHNPQLATPGSDSASPRGGQACLHGSHSTALQSPSCLGQQN